MKCPHCGQEHPDNYQFCPIIGGKLESLKACTNENCPDYGKYILPPDSVYCSTCGQPINRQREQQTNERNDSSSKIIFDDCLDELNKLYKLKK